MTKFTIHTSSHIGDKNYNQDVLSVTRLNNVETIIDSTGYYQITNKPYLMIIADGHGGKGIIGKTVADFITTSFNHKFNTVKLSLEFENIGNIFNSVNVDLRNSNLDFYGVGSTVIVTIIYSFGDSMRMIVCNTGDCRLICCSDTNVLNATDDHKPNSERELKRFQQISDKIDPNRVMKVKFRENDVPRIGKMAVSRSFGDIEHFPYVIHTPDIYFVNLSVPQIKYIVIACDGLWDCFSNEDVLKILRKNTCIQENGSPLPVSLEESSTATVLLVPSPGLASSSPQPDNQAKLLINECMNESVIQNDSMDNTSIIVIEIDQRPF